MSMDGLLIRGSVAELRERASGWRLNQVTETTAGEYILTFRGRGTSARWAADVNQGRAHGAFTERRRENVQSPAPFVMLLRKHLSGTRLKDAGQPALDRIVWLHLEGPHPHLPAGLGGGSYKLYVELFGRPGNIILTDARTGHVIDARRRYSPAAPGPGGRIVWPGRPYTPPLPPGGVNPLEDAIDEDDLTARLAELIAGGAPPRRALMMAIRGVGPHTAREIIYRAERFPAGSGPGEDSGGRKMPPGGAAGGSRDVSPAALAGAAARLVEQIRQEGLQPWLARDSGGPAAWGAVPLDGHGARGLETVLLPTFGALMDTVLSHRRDRDRQDRLRQRLTRGLGRARRRARRRLDARRTDLAEGEQAEGQRRFGELLIANLHLLQRKPGTRPGTKAAVTDPMNPDGPPVEVPLDPRLTPAQNAEAYFAKYRRLKRKADLAARAVKKAEQDLYYIESLLLAAHQAETAEQLEEVAREAADTLGPASAGMGPPGKRAPGRRDGARPARGSPEPAPPHRFVSRHGYTILVGRNNRQNDQITLRTARPHDVWVHVKDAPGAHVVIRQPHRREEVPPGTIEDAALLAAYFSGLRGSSGVPVDWTLARYVRKPKGSPPGMVIYEGHKTVYVTPTEEDVARLKVGAEKADP